MVNISDSDMVVVSVVNMCFSEQGVRSVFRVQVS